MAHSPSLPSTRPGHLTARLGRALDAGMARLLCVRPQPPTPGAPTAPPFGTPLVISAVRCIGQYIVVPFVLPLAGLVTGVALGIGLLLDLVAAVSIVATLRTLWRLQHPRRWQYLPLALVLVGVFAVFLMGDVRLGPLAG